jgi:glycosyltransferase involved in cell wall biosynthesis
MSLPERAVCLDAQGSQSPQHHDRGIARYVVEHVRALHRAQPNALHSVLLNPTLALTGNLNWLIGKGLIGWTSSDRRIDRRAGDLPAIYHVMSPFELTQSIDALWPTWARGSSVRTVVTLYDLIPLVFAEHYLRDPVVRASYQTRLEFVRSADHVLAISRTTAKDAIEHLGIHPDRISVIDAGATEKFATMYSSPAVAWEVLRHRLPGLRPGYLLYVAGFEFRKNLQRVIEAYGILSPDRRADHQLVIACRMLPSETETVRGWAKAAGIDPEHLVLTGYVSDIELGALYHACTLFIFASLYEGSGLPILEAMSCGAPVVASNTSTGPEILGDTDGTFDPYDPAAIARCLTAVVDSAATLAALAQRSRQRVDDYTWKAVAEHSQHAYEHMLQTRPLRRRCHRARIALISPWPPEQSGIADYSFRLARELGEQVDVDVIVDNPIDSYAPPKEPGVRLAHSSSFRATEQLRQYDRLVYCMGNSAFHGHVYKLLRERPGAVLAHDVRLTGFYRWFAEQECPENPAGRSRERIEALYGTRLPPSAIAGGMPDWDEQAALGIYMTREIQQYAEQIFVHSHHAREVLELDRGPLDRPVPISVLPLALPPTAPRGHRSLDPSPLIASFGVVSEVKGLATLIGAVALLVENYPEIRLTIAGPGEQAELERWRDFAADAAPAAAITVTGHLPPTRYEQLLRDVDIAVQLRTLSNGEASAAVVDCLAAGIPTIVSDLGWASELPTNTVARVPIDCTATHLAAHLEQLIESDDVRQRLSHGAHAYAREHSFAEVATKYLRLLELA